jgi:hypothetical protein
MIVSVNKMKVLVIYGHETGVLSILLSTGKEIELFEFDTRADLSVWSHIQTNKTKIDGTEFDTGINRTLQGVFLSRGSYEYVLETKLANNLLQSITTELMKRYRIDHLLPCKNVINVIESA